VNQSYLDIFALPEMLSRSQISPIFPLASTDVKMDAQQIGVVRKEDLSDNKILDLEEIYFKVCSSW